MHYSSVKGSIGFLASGIIHHYSPQASYSRICKREITSPFCYTEADQVSSAIACRAPILVERLALILDAPYYTSTFGEEQASSCRTVATVPLISSAGDSSYFDEILTSCPECGPGEEKYSGSTQSSVTEGGRKGEKSPLWLTRCCCSDNSGYCYHSRHLCWGQHPPQQTGF